MRNRQRRSIRADSCESGRGARTIRVAQQLRELMAEQNLRREHIALAANISAQAVDKYLTGKSKPGYKSLMALRSAYPTFAARIDRSEAA